MKAEFYSEKEIVTGCQQGDRRFQEMLYRRYAQKMYGICMSYAGNRDFAQDMLQESFIKVFRAIHAYNNTGSLEGWVRRVVVNTAIDLLRQQTGIKKLINEKPQDEATISENEAIPSIGLGEVLQFIKRLPEGARVIFNLFAVEGYTHKEIAKQLNISIGTSKSQYNRARNMLKEWLGDVNKW